MGVEVYDHAVHQYSQRKLNIRGIVIEEHPAKKEKIKHKIKVMVYQPDKIVHTDKDRLPMHIKYGLAAVVGVETEDSHRPYNSLREDIVVPTVKPINNEQAKNKA